MAAYDTGSTLQNNLNARDWDNIKNHQINSAWFPGALNPNGPDGTASTGDEFSDSPTTVSNVTPLTGGAAGGTVVTVTGTNFGSVTALQFGSGANGTSFSKTATTVVATTPAHAAGAVDILLVNATVAGTTGPSLGTMDTNSNFTYT